MLRAHRIGRAWVGVAATTVLLVVLVGLALTVDTGGPAPTAQTATVLDAGQLDRRTPDFTGVPGLGAVVGVAVLGPVDGRHLVVVEKPDSKAPNELLVTDDGVEFVWREAANFFVGRGDATDVIVGANLLWLTLNDGSGSVYRSADGVSWAEVESPGGQPIEHEKQELDQSIVRRGSTIVTAARSTIFTSPDDGHAFVESRPFGDIDGDRFLTVGATSEEFFAVAAQGDDGVAIAYSGDGLGWTVHPAPVEVEIALDEGASFGKVSGDDPSLLLVTDVQGPRIFRYARSGADIHIDEVAALDADLIADIGFDPRDPSVLVGISAHQWQGRFVIRIEDHRWVLFLSDDGADWRPITDGGAIDAGRPVFSNELIFIGSRAVLAIKDIAID